MPASSPELPVDNLFISEGADARHVGAMHREAVDFLMRAVAGEQGGVDATTATEATSE